MSAALRLVDLEPLGAPTMSPASLASPRSSMCPTLVPRPPSTLRPANDSGESFGTQPPMTQRSATLHPRTFGPAQHETYNLLAVMRLNVEFLVSLLGNGAPAVAHEAFEDLHRSIDRLEHRCAAALPLLPSRGR